LGAIIGQFKSSVTRRFNQIVSPENALGHPVWQRNFYDKVVRSDEQLRAYQKYIANGLAINYTPKHQKTNLINLMGRGMLETQAA
jgi:hypothetical protein